MHLFFSLLFSCKTVSFTPIIADTTNMVLISSSQQNSPNQAITFLMGYPDTEPGPYGNHWKETAQPQHEVSLSPFYIDKTEVTVDDYVDMLNDLKDNSVALKRLLHPLMPITQDLENNLFSVQDGYEQHPMNYISWYESMVYCSHIGKRLPTEAEWEVTAKGDDIENPRAVPWEGGGWSCQKAVYYTNETLCEKRPTIVGSHPLGNTPQDVSDLGGNVSEWVYDWFDYYPAESQNNPIGPSEGSYKIVRGGGFRDSSDALRTTDRVAVNPKTRSEGIGFRCALSYNSQ